VTGWGELKIAVVGNFNPPDSGIRYQAEVLADAFEEEGASVLRSSFQQNRYRRPFSTLAELVRRRRAYDVLCVQAFSFGNFVNAAVAIAAGRLLRRRVVVVYRGGGGPRFLKRHRWLVPWLLRRAHALVVPSGYLAAAFGPFGLEPRIIHNVIDPAAFPFRERQEFRPHVVWVRHLRKGYNPWLAVEVHRRLRQRFPEATLTMVGGGYMLEEMTQRIEAERIEGVTLTGEVSQEKIREILNESDVFINTTNVDNQPRSLLEAMSAGLPVVTTDVDGIPFLVESGRNGVTVPPREPDLMATEVIRILEDPAHGRSLVAEARRRLQAEFTWEAVVPRWRQVLAGGDGAA
jgi:glycosyltransferase involved in cell wall biosynthesis